MPSLNKTVFIVFLTILISSCENLSNIFTYNVYRELDKSERLTIKSSDVTGWTSENREVNVLYYSDIALDDYESALLFNALKNDPVARAEIIYSFNELLSDFPDLTNPVEVDRYQKIAAALAKIEIYSTNASVLSSVDDLVISYASGANEGSFDQDSLLTDVFDIPLTYENQTEKDNKTAELTVELRAIMNCGLAYEKLGTTITDTDRPSSNYISDKDAVAVLLSSMVNAIIDTTVTHAVPAKDREQALTSLVEGLVDRSPGSTGIVYPADVGASESNKMLLYLGEGGALTFTATGFELPSVSSLGGN